MRSLLIGQSRKDQLRRFLKRLAFVVGAVVLCLILSYTAFRRWTLMTPPTDSSQALPQEVSIQEQAGVPHMSLGESWMEWRDGLWRLHLAGGPREMGHAHGLLAGQIVERIESDLEDIFASYVTSPSRRWLLGNAMRWRFRHLPQNLPPQRLVELAAFSRTMVETREYPERAFQRLVYYHALHDMTQRLAGSPLIGCTAFAVWGSHTLSGNLIVGRNFDFEVGEVFDEEKAVLSFATSGRIPFVSVAWPGMMGVVTGINAKQLYVSMNAARTDDPLEPGIPMGFLLREILERASSIKEALVVIKEQPVMVAEALLLADGKVPEAVVVELSPQGPVVRRSSSPSIGVANHFLEPKYKGDASNDRLQRYTTSGARYQRLNQLLSRFRGRMDVPTAAMILRNRTGLDDVPLALGNRNAIDALIATHGVVVDVSRMVLWVSRGPQLLAEFVPVDLRPIFGLPIADTATVEPVAADLLRSSAPHKRFQLARRQMELARRLAEQGQHERALDFGRRATLSEPESPGTHKLFADLLWAAGRYPAAKEHYRRFLTLHPPYKEDIEQVKQRLKH